MKLYNKIDELLKQERYIIDLLPLSFTHINSNDEQFFEETFRKFADIILKCNEYFDFSLICDSEEDIIKNPISEMLYEKIIECTKNATYLNILIEKENAMIIINGEDSYFTLYNPNARMKQIFQSLSAENGLSFRKENPNDIHNFIQNEFLQNKSVSALVWLVDKGREIEFSYMGNQYFISKSNSCSYVSLWDKDYEQGFTSVEMLWEFAEIGEERLQLVWENIEIDTLF